MSSTRPSKPSLRSVSAAFAPARLAPTMTWVWSVVMGASCCEGHELLACASVVSNQPVQRGGHGLGPELLDSAQRHAQVLGFQDHADALGRELALQPAGDLRRQAFLDLQVAGEALHHAPELAEAHDPLS